ncbi:type 1 glutamine amidotransferase domain-containing protein [Gloeocapsopsis dulcis]|uniref:Type 1 glutamine amidotransferase domain-containing protein n=1 Tax=Gloeocapsopsis dulcis AAB1 = 1H9 TaxID=1433147 RepID=A0A6N8FVH4_9CHRO|nr:type 1 glutamine amidotransferase domain-containing protein [Gloeocapsopsis dulcis]MUL36325.1 type 1 glutamine amidotransferase domain-containing protein [Gloeocapsopsis dulcis AAB1 = 1H9]WNN88178.1 type 1 glutamine amidotransferase domain-containing protein [Gloeocapsopsis dulcis]
MHRRILIVVTSHEELGNTGKKTGFYLSEATHPYDVFSRAGYEVDFVSPKGGKAPMDGVKLEDPLNKAFLDDPEKVKQVENTLQPSQIEANQYDAIFYAGGHGTMWDFPNNEELAQIAANIYEQGGVVGAVCHGPAGLVNIKLANGEYLIKGKTVSGFTNEEEAAVELTEAVPFLLESKLKEQGAEFTKAANFEPHVVKSDRLVTGQNPASAASVAEQMLELIENRNFATAAPATV